MDDASKAVACLRRSEATLCALLDSSVQAILTVNANGKLLVVNNTAEKMFGYYPDELIGQPLELLLPKYQREFFADSTSPPRGLGVDKQGLRQDGSKFPVEVSLNNVETSKGKLGVAFITDLTERKRTEAALAESRDEIRALAARLLTNLEDERRRVSRELHDQVCQSLAILALEIGGLALMPSPLKRVPSCLKTLHDRVIKVAEEARILAYQLHPSVLDDLGLVAALKSLCKHYFTMEGVAVEFDSGAMPEPMPTEIAFCLYRIAEQALNNIGKHAHAKRIFVKLSHDSGGMFITIADDGIGFDMEAVKGRARLGLAGMRERARLLDGKLTIESQPGRGTRIVLEIPLPA